MFLVFNLFLLFFPFPFPFSVSGQPRAAVVSRPQYLSTLFDRPFSFVYAKSDSTDADAFSAALPASPLDAWQQWRTVENYYYGKNRGSLPMVADLNALHPYFRDRVIELLSLCKSAGIELAIVESYRTPAKQAQYFAMGRKYTSSSSGRSRHQYGLAVDVVPLIDSVAVWNNKALWRKIGAIGESLGLRWGGRWRVTYDPGHFEWSGGLSKRELEEGEWPEIPAPFSDQYSSIEEKLLILQKNWQAWAVDQSEIANNRSLSSEEKTVGVGN